MRTTRRELVGAAAAGATFAAVPPVWAKRLLSRRAAVGPGKFLDGVASGEPSSSAVTFWSRLTTGRPRSGARLIVSRDENMSKVVATAVVPTGRSINGTLKARIGGLKPHSHYYYVWESGEDVSPVGRTRTLLPAGSQQGLRLAFASCQAYAFGYFRAHADAAAQDLDLAVHLGDYIYEVRRTGPDVVRPDPIDSNDLASYRAKYQIYRGDEALRELHRIHPMVHIWDDHEVANNYTDNHPAPSPLQRAAAYRVAFEWLPRVVYPSERFRVFKKISLGSTADLFLLDERQYRAVDDAGQPVKILGDRQLDWLIKGLQSSSATWKLIANQVVISPLDLGDKDGGVNEDSWGGYGNSRQRLLSAVEAAGIDNVVFYTGDAHLFMQNVLASDPEVFRSDPSHRASAIEYVGGSVTTPGRDHVEAEVEARNPWVHMYNGVNHGYAFAALDPSVLVTDFRRSDLLSPTGLTTTFERFTQAAGTNLVTRESFPA